MSFLLNPYQFGINYGNDFVIEMATTGAAETVTIPCQDDGTFSANIDWGDATGDSTITTWNDGDLAHEYADAGDHIIRISGAFPNIYFNDVGDKLKVKRVLNIGDTGLELLNNAFRGCSNLTSVASESANVTGVGSMNGAFLDCGALVTCEAGGWVTTSLHNLGSAFGNCGSLDGLDVSGWDTSGVTNVAWTFSNCSLLTDVRIDLWAIEAITNFNGMFFGAGLTTARYDATLIAWDLQNPSDGETPDFGSSTYTSPGAAADARASLEGAPDNWVITDGGTA